MLLDETLIPPFFFSVVVNEMVSFEQAEGQVTQVIEVYLGEILL
jgi:hypothetical protein